MLISTVPIEHKTKHPQEIFSIHKNKRHFATGSINGEVKIWTKGYRLVTTIKKHKGSVSSVRFSPGDDVLATSGDDGYVHLYEAKSYQHIRSVKHPSDVTNIEWKGDTLYSVDINGNVYATEKDGETKKHKISDKPITGLAVVQNAPVICAYSEGTLVLCNEMKVTKKIDAEKGIILESLNSRMSVSPNQKYISVGMQFNNKAPTIDIFDMALNRIFSLIGHVSPCEITSFCPTAFQTGKERYYVLAVASQDLSISFWTTARPHPFLLLKNFTDAPVLDLLWDGCVLYACSYDGRVKKIVFEKKELGDPIAVWDEDINELDLPLSVNNLEKREIEDLESVKRADVKLEGYECQGKALDEMVRDSKKTGTENKSDKTDNTENKSDKKDNTEKSNKTDAEKSNKTGAEKKDTEKIMRIKPIAVDENGENTEKTHRVPVKTTTEGGTVALFDAELPAKLKMEKTENFKFEDAEIRAEIDENHTELRVFRANRLFFKISGQIQKVAINRELLVVYTDYVRIYSLETGILIFPYISMRVAFMDVLSQRILLLDVYGNFNIIGLHADSPTFTGKLAKTKGLKKVELSKKYFLLASYTEGEVLYYSASVGAWMVLESCRRCVDDYIDVVDTTIDELELRMVNSLETNSQEDLVDSLRGMISLIIQKGYLEEYFEYKLERGIAAIRDRMMQKKMIMVLNSKEFLYKVSERICRKLNIY